jgi:hypothetical protein
MSGAEKSRGKEGFLTRAKGAVFDVLVPRIKNRMETRQKPLFSDERSWNFFRAGVWLGFGQGCARFPKVCGLSIRIAFRRRLWNGGERRGQKFSAKVMILLAKLYFEVLN